jgi:nucleotide-binding universal stress UspA family protein
LPGGHEVEERHSMVRRILIGYDGSEHGRDALALGRLLAEALEATPLVAVVLPNPERLVGIEHAEAELTAHAEELFQQARSALPGLGTETTLLRDYTPGRALHALGSEEGPLLTVIGSAHRGLLGRVLLGSTGEALLSGAPSPVAVAPAGYAGAGTRRLLSIAVAVDGSREAEGALETAIALARRLNAELTILSGAPPPHWGYAAAFAALSGDSDVDLGHQQAERALERAVEQVPDGIPIETRVLRGEPASAIAEAAVDFDLLILGSRGYGPIRGVFLGSVSAPLVRQAPCPVLVLSRGIGQDPLGLLARTARAEG